MHLGPACVVYVQLPLSVLAASMVTVEITFAAALVTTCTVILPVSRSSRLNSCRNDPQGVLRFSTVKLPPRAGRSTYSADAFSGL